MNEHKKQERKKETLENEEMLHTKTQPSVWRSGSFGSEGGSDFSTFLYQRRIRFEGLCSCKSTNNVRSDTV